jgi:DNA-binding response OmpR family regulator
MSKPKILVIDDDKDYLELIDEALEEQFVVSCVHSIQAADTLVNEGYVCDIALVDEYLGEEKGSEWIAKHKKAGSKITSYILYSGLATEEEILKGLACGADDFLVKPISLTALNKRLLKLLDHQHEMSNFKIELASKDNVINISMAQASKYGSCMQLTSKLNNCFSYEQIRDNVFTFLHNMNLKGCIAFYPLKVEPTFYNSSNGVCSPVEIDVMKLLKIKPRLYRFGNRTIFNHSLVSILILNLDQESVDTDIYIDAFASVIECIGARMAFITYKNSLVDVQTQIQQAVHSTKKMVEVSKHHQQEIMNEIVQKFGMSFHVLDMSDEQEQYLTELVHGALKKHSQDDVNFLEVSDLLDGALRSVDELKQLNEEVAEDITEIDDEDELF